jgi:peptidyl-prolyl cis-trans isomerase C
MTRRRSSGIGWLGTGCTVAVLTVACGETSAPPPVSHGELARGIVAEVGPEKVAAETVARIAGVEGVSPREALAPAVFDALMAAGARADLPSVVASAERRALAHALLKTLWVKAREEPITDAELAEATNVHWTRYDRPEGYRTVHYVVKVDEGAGEQTRRKAKALAKKLREAVIPIAERAKKETAPELDEGEMFRQKHPHPDPIVKPWKEAIEDQDHEGLSVVAQPLPPITAEGRVIESGVADAGAFDENFAREASALDERGALTDVFETYAGYHVAMLLEVTPPKRLPRAERLARLRDEILRVRALRRRRSLLKRLREDRDVEMPTNLDALLYGVRVSLDED